MQCNLEKFELLSHSPTIVSRKCTVLPFSLLIKFLLLLQLGWIAVAGMDNLIGPSISSGRYLQVIMFVFFIHTPHFYNR